MKIVFTILFCSLAIAGFSQVTLTNTKWTGVANIPDPYDVQLEFKKDTFLLIADAQTIETMWYGMKGDTITIKKLVGMSPCDEQEGTYKITIKDDKLILTAISDPCMPRVNAFTPEGYLRKKE